MRKTTWHKPTSRAARSRARKDAWRDFVASHSGADSRLAGARRIVGGNLRVCSACFRPYTLADPDPSILEKRLCRHCRKILDSIESETLENPPD